jgi:hypothetical protein
MRLPAFDCAVPVRKTNRLLAAPSMMSASGVRRDCSGFFRLEPIAGWGSHPLENAAFHM